MKKIIIWGTGAGYDEVILHLKADIVQGKIEIIALVSSYKELISHLDGKKVILPEEIKEYEFDYIIIANKEYEKEIKKSAIKIGIDNKKIIGYRVLCHSLFDLDRYVKILDSNISIVSDECWGGVVYSTLSLQFNSPFINLYVMEYDTIDKYVTDDYYKLVSNLEYYLRQPLELVREGNKTRFPIGKIGDVILCFNHSSSFAEAKKDWDRRVKRFNFNNYIIKKTIYDDDDAKRFSQLPIKNKIGFYNKDINLEGIVCLKNYEKSQAIKEGCNFSYYVRYLSKLDVAGLKEYDIFKLLAGEKDFLRCK